MNDRCAALASEGQTSEGGERYACTIYDDRPRSCRDFARGGERCLEARRRVGVTGIPTPGGDLRVHLSPLP